MSDSLPFKGKASKAFVKHLISTGRYTVHALDGTPITDYKKLFADINESTESTSESGSVPGVPEVFAEQIHPSKLQEHQTRHGIPELTRPEKVIPVNPYLVINGVNYTRRQLEHFGDAVVALVSRLMVHELTKTDQRLYFNFTSQLITNEVLGNGNRQRGDEVEITIGTRLAQSGIDSAMQLAREIIAETEPWKNLVKLMEEP